MRNDEVWVKDWTGGDKVFKPVPQRPRWQDAREFEEDERLLESLGQ